MVRNRFDYALARGASLDNSFSSGNNLVDSGSTSLKVRF